MKHFIGRFRTAGTIALVAAIFSFSTHGGEGFEVYLDDKLLVQQFGQNMKNVKTIQLDQNASQQQLVVRYHHCGQVAKNRVITIRDGKNKILREWKYANAAAASVTNNEYSMPCKVKDIVGLLKTHPGKLNLYYTSSELPAGRLLLSITGTDVAKK